MHNKDILRSTLLRQRKNLLAQTIIQHSSIVCDKLINLKEFQQYKTIGSYFPLVGEIDTHSIFEKCWELKKTCYLPKLKPYFQMDFCLYNKDTLLQTNSLNISEPVHSEIISPTKLDMVLVPLIAFDAVGHRLGFGAGYYDRYFEFHKNHPTTKPLLIGLAHSFQEVPAIKPDVWDVDLDIVLTEKNIFYCN